VSEQFLNGTSAHRVLWNWLILVTGIVCKCNYYSCCWNWLQWMFHLPPTSPLGNSDAACRRRQTGVGAWTTTHTLSWLAWAVNQLITTGINGHQQVSWYMLHSNNNSIVLTDVQQMQQ